jgi:hypothetical protein
MPLESAQPRARASDLVVKDVGNEVLVYDLARHRAHRLNRAAAAVWRACDGTRTLPALAAVAAGESGQAMPVEAVRYALQELGRARLLENPVQPRGLTRRQVIARVGGAAAVALPLVATVVPPTAAQAQSVVCVDLNESCTVDEDCCGPTCLGAPFGCECFNGVCELD